MIITENESKKKCESRPLLIRHFQWLLTNSCQLTIFNVEYSFSLTIHNFLASLLNRKILLKKQVDSNGLNSYIWHSRYTSSYL